MNSLREWQMLSLTHGDVEGAVARDSRLRASLAPWEVIRLDA
jgi:hypothetical protein